MKHHYPVRALSLLCALAIFMSLLPATLAADTEDDAALTAALEKAVVQDAVTPAGVQLNLFDYWVDTRTSTDTHTEYANVKDSGINKEHYLKFISSGPQNGADNINQWTGSSSPKSGIVQNRLSGGYPVLTSGNAYGTNQTTDITTEQSLAYLFDKSDEDGTYGSTTSYKKTFWDVAGLLRVGKDGYYYYNANQSNVGVNKYENANYAYFNKETNAFTLYNNWAVQSGGSSGIQGQFFPFTDPKTVFALGSNNALTQASISSDSDDIHHYFGMTMTTRFVQRYGGMTTEDRNKAMTFQFAGDDDVWIFIDGVLVADLGGIHNQATTTINFFDGTITINGEPAGTLKEKMSQYYSDAKYPNFWRGDTFSDDTYHTLKLFYLERGGTDSNLAMKFNLAYVPETDGIKVDQNGTLLPGVQFDLYAAERTDNGNGTYKYTKTSNDPIGSGTTDADGRFVLTNADDIAVSLNDLHKRSIQYLILEEQNKNRTGYRHDDSIYLVLQSKDVESILLNDENHRWTTGTYAAAKETISTGPNITMPATKDKPKQETANLDDKEGMLFGVIMRRMNNVGVSVPKSGVDEWGVVTGSALSGWQVTGRASSTNGYIQAALDAIQKPGNEKNCVIFEPAANGAWMAEFNHCPGDLRNYYYWEGGKNTAYAVAFFYTTAATIAEATVDNTRWVDDTDFERQFAATIYIPNVKHYLNVQKLDDNNDPVNGVTFALYKQDDLTITGTGWSVNEGKSAYDTVITGTDGKAQFPSEGHVLAEGKYYLVEDRAPVGYKVNATAVPILVDDEHGVMADAGTPNDGVAVTVAEGHLVPTMTPFATVDDIDRTLTNITTTRMEAESGWDPTLEKAGQTVNLKLDTESFKKDHPVQTLRYIPVNTENKSLSWRTETGWLWFHIEQTPIADDDPDKNLKTNLGNRDLTRLFTGETTVIVTNQRVGTLAVSKTVDNTTTEALSSNRYKIEIGLNDKTYSGIVNCTSKIGTADATNVPLTFASGKVTYQIKGGETLTLLDLPIGTTWKVEETEPLNSDNWETTVTSTGGTVTNKVASGEIKDTNQNDTVDITNTYYAATPTKAEATIKVSKEYVEGEGKTAYTGDVSFTLTRDSSNSADDPLANSSPMTISITGKASKSFETLEFTKAGTYTYTVSEVKGGVNGMTYAETVYTVTFEVERGAGSDRNKLVATPTYTVVEKPGDASNPYTYTDTTGLLFTNTYNPGSSEEQDKGSLSIHKTLVKPDNVTTGLPENYEIKITLSHYDGISSSSQIGSSEPQSVTLTFTGGEATYHIQAGKTLTLTGLPVGTTWTVTETAQLDSKYWRTAYKVNGQDATTVSGDISAANKTDAVIITNTYTPNGGEIVPETGSLSISKVIEGSIAATTEFDFRVTVTGASGSYHATLNGTATNDVVFSDAGVATVTLKGGETLKISGLPAGVSYTVTETTTGYDVTYENATGKIVKDETVTCKVTNELKGSGGEEDPKSGTATINVSKAYATGEGKATYTGDVSFTLTPANNNPDGVTASQTISITQDGSNNFALNFTKPGMYTYTVSEVNNGVTGMTYDATVYTVIFNVTEGAGNELVATAIYKIGDATYDYNAANKPLLFTNTYTTSGGDDGPGPGPGPGPNPGGDDGGTPALNRRDHYAYIIGYPDGDVHPQGNITRAEVATIFFRLLRDPVRTQYWSQTNDYPDVAFNKWYNNAISTLTNMGIICGYPDGSFRPDAPITRAELTKIAASFFSDPRVAATYDGRFSDVQGAEWYISYLMTAIKEGLIEGYPDGSFRPDRPITRAETCTIVNRTLGRKPDKDHLLPESVMINWPDNLDRNVWYYAQMQEATNSHDYRWTSVYSEVCEQWTAKLIERDWAALERTWSHANSAPGGEVMQ